MWSERGTKTPTHIEKFSLCLRPTSQSNSTIAMHPDAHREATDVRNVKKATEDHTRTKKKQVMHARPHENTALVEHTSAISRTFARRTS
jgi:hypothetical protein